MVNFKYSDILDLPHHQSEKHVHMPNIDRAAQFSPFAALTGYDAAVRETARLTEEKLELDETQKSVIDLRFQLLCQHLSEKPPVTFFYFIKDSRKEGGRYAEKTGIVKKIDTSMRLIHLEDGTIIPFDDLYTIDGDLFRSLERDYI